MEKTVTVEDLIYSFKTVEHEKYNEKLLEWLVEKGHFNLKQELPLDFKRAIPEELEDEFRSQQTYDVVVFGSKIWIIEEDVSLERAKEVCNSPKTKGDNWFTGFAIHGQYKNLPKGEPLEV